MYFMVHRRVSYESSIGSIKRSAMGHHRSNRQLFEGILWLLRSGTGWPDLPDRYPSPSTCWPRWRRWEEDGTWLRVWRRLIDGEETFIDGSSVAAKKGGLQSEKPKVARGFLSEATFVRPHRRKWPWSRPHWLDWSQRRRSSLWLLTKPMTVSPDVNDWPVNTLSWWQRIEKIDRRTQHKRSPPTRLAKTMENRAHHQLADELWPHCQAMGSTVDHVSRVFSCGPVSS